MADEEECCPLCMEEMDLTDKTFNACPCGYQVCLWCWHQIKNEYNALCPACRAPYGELSKQKSPLDREDVLRRTKQRKAKEKSERRAAAAAAAATASSSSSSSSASASASSTTASSGSASAAASSSGASSSHGKSSGSNNGSGAAATAAGNRRNLANVRVMQRNLVYVIGLPQRFADDDVLRAPECFGQYGRIVKAVVNKSHLHSDRSNATASAYITFASKDDAMTCIIAVDGFYLDGSLLRASFGTTKYCNFFLRNMTCNNSDCLYLHELGEQDDSFTKDEMQSALHASKAAFRDLTTNEIRSGSRFPPPVKTANGSSNSSSSRNSGGAQSRTGSSSSASAHAHAHASGDRQAHSAAAVHKLRLAASSSSSSSHRDLRRGNSYSRIVTGVASSSSSSSSASSSPPSSPTPPSSSSPPPPPPPHASPNEAERPPSSAADDRKPNLHVDTSVGNGASGSRRAGADGIVGPLEALKLATGSSSQEPAWAMPFPSAAITLQSDADDALTGGADPVFSPFGLGFDRGVREGASGTTAPLVHDPWTSSSKSMSPVQDTPGHDETIPTSHFAPTAASAFPPLGLNGAASARSNGSSSGLSGLSFASIDAIFSHRDEPADPLAGLMGMPLAAAPPSTPTTKAAASTAPPPPLVHHRSPSPAGDAKSGAHSSRFAFANPPTPSPMSELRDGAPSTAPLGSAGLPSTSPYRPLHRYSSFCDVSAPPPPPQGPSMFPSPNDPRAFPPASSHVFARSTSDPFPSTGFGGLGDSNDLAFLQQMLPNVNISYGGDFPSAGSSSAAVASSRSVQDATSGGGWDALGFDANAARAGGNGSAPFYDPAIVAAPGLSSFYGLGDDDRLRQQQSRAFGGSFRQ